MWQHHETPAGLEARRIIMSLPGSSKAPVDVTEECNDSEPPDHDVTGCDTRYRLQ